MSLLFASLKRNAFVLGILLFFSCSNRVEIVEEKYENGNSKVVVIYELTKSEKIKIEETVYYPDGKKKMSGKFKDNKRQDKWTAWHKNGNIWSVGHYKKGLREGEAKVYYESGKLHFEGTYKEDEARGTWKWYDESGKLINEEKK